MNQSTQEEGAGMKMRPNHKLVRTLVMAITIGLVAPVSVDAAQLDDRAALETAALLDTAAKVEDGIAVAETHAGFETATPEGQLTIPQDAAGAILLEGLVDVSIGVPGGAAADATLVDDTVVFSDVAEDANVAVNATEGGGVQMLITIESPSAPKEYDFPVAVPDGGHLQSNSDGSVSVVVDGEEIGGFAAPWATDANGQDVATRYVVNGTTLTQWVDVTADSAFPIVADPWYNPFSWNWRKVGRATVAGLTRCLGGAAKTTLGVGSGVVAANVTAKIVAGRMMVQMAGGPWGYFAVGAAGCVNGIIS